MTGPGPEAFDRRALRAAMRERRQTLPAAARMQAAEAIATHLLADPAFGPGYVAGYWAMGGELPLHVLQMRLRPDQVWCLPCLETDGHLRFAPWRPGDPLVSNRFGIPEPDVAPSSRLDPEELSIVLLPLVAFSAAGTRLGMGGAPRLVGVGYGFQREDALAAEPWDVPLDAVATEAGLFACPAAG